MPSVGLYPDEVGGSEEVIKDGFNLEEGAKYQIRDVTTVQEDGQEVAGQTVTLTLKKIQYNLVRPLNAEPIAEDSEIYWDYYLVSEESKIKGWGGFSYTPPRSGNNAPNPNSENPIAVRNAEIDAALDAPLPSLKNKLFELGPGGIALREALFFHGFRNAAVGGRRRNRRARKTVRSKKHKNQKKRKTRRHQ